MTNTNSNTHIVKLAEAESLTSFLWTVSEAYTSIADKYDAMQLDTRSDWGNAASNLASLLQEDEQLTMQETILSRVYDLLTDAAEDAENNQADAEWWESYEETASRFCSLASVDSIEEYGQE